MNVWINANERFSLKIDGKYFFSHEACILIKDLPPSYIEVLPHSNKQPTCFYLNYSHISHKNCTFTLLEDGLYINVCFLPIESKEFKILHQKRYEKVLVTVYKDGLTRIVCENDTHVETVSVPERFVEFDSQIIGDRIIVTSKSTNYFICAFSIDNGIKTIYCNEANDYELKPIFRTQTTLFNLERTTVWCEWLGKDKLTPKVVETTYSCPYTIEKGNAFLKRCFFERVLLKLPLESLLCEKLKPNADKINGYLEGFSELLPDFCTKKGVYLVSKNNGKRTAKIFDIETENGLVSNIIEI